MKVTTVTVEINEKRNHPTAYGNRGARVAYTVELEEGDAPDSVTMQLREQARAHVDGELDQWIAELELKGRRESVRRELNYAVSNALEGYLSDGQKAEFEDDLSILPPDEQEEHRQRLAKAQETFLENTRRRLNEFIEKATASGAPSSRQKDRFENGLNHLPKDERKSYQDRMDVALVQPASDPIAQAADPTKEEEVPF